MERRHGISGLQDGDAPLCYEPVPILMGIGEMGIAMEYQVYRMAVQERWASPWNIRFTGW